MDFLVIYFAFDNLFQAVCKSKVKYDKAVAEIVKGTKCQVPFETESISEDGKEIVETELYDGIILCSGQVKKKAEELTAQCQKKIMDGIPIDNIFEEFQQNFKRTASAKLTEAIKELREEEPSEKKKLKKDKISTNKSATCKSKKDATTSGSSISGKASKKSKDTCKTTSIGKKSALHPEKMAEISAMLNLGQPDDQPRSHDPDFVEVVSTCISTPKRQEICSPKKTETVSMYEEISPVKDTVTNITDTCPTPRRSPRKHCSSVLFTPSQSTGNTRYSSKEPISTPGPSTDNTRYSSKEPISTPGPSTDNTRYSSKEPISTPGPSTDKWDGVFVNAVDMVSSIYDLDDKHVHELHTNFNSSPVVSDKNDIHFNNEAQTKKETICNLLGITEEEAATTSRVLGKLSNILGGHHDMPSFMYNDMNAPETPVPQATWLPPSSTDCSISTPTHFTPTATFVMNTEAEIESPKSMVRESKSDDKQLTVLIKDSLDPTKFKDVLVVKSEERQARLHAKSSKRPAIALLNSILSCVYTQEELGVSCGLGIRKMKDVGSPLDATKMEAIREYILYHCTREGWQLPSKVEFNTTVTNKVTNCRRKLSKHPALKKKSC